jgi:hypothetical protein
MQLLKQWAEDAAENAGRFLRGRAFLWCCVVVVVLCAADRVVVRPFYAWNDIRLTRTFALLEGEQIYPGPADGPLHAGIYGPVGFALYAPAVIFSSPNAALAAGIFLSIVMGFVPVLLIFRDSRIASEVCPRLRALLLCAVVFHFYFASAEQGLWNIHVDAPAVFLAALGLYAALRHGGRDTFSWALGASIVFCALAPWAKQTVAPALLAPPLYFWCLGNRRAALQFVLGLAVASCFLGAVFGAWFGFDRLVFSMMTTPGRHSLTLWRILDARQQVHDFLDIMFLAALLVVALLLLRGEQQELPAGRREQVFDWNAWPIFLAATIFVLPTAILGRLKEGGADNNYGPVDYFLTIAVVLCLLRLTARPAFRTHRVLPGALTVAIGLLLSMQMLRALPGVVHLPGQLAVFLRGTPSQEAFEFARANPGKTFFAWHPLGPLLAEGRLYHISYGVHQRGLAGFEVSPSHLRAHLPPRMEYVAVKSVVEPYTLMPAPEFACETSVDGLPGWTVWVRPEHSACPTAAPKEAASP